MSSSHRLFILLVLVALVVVEAAAGRERRQLGHLLAHVLGVPHSHGYSGYGHGGYGTTPSIHLQIIHSFIDEVVVNFN